MSYDGRGLKFGTVAQQYDLYRPSPPPEAVTLFGDLSGLDVLEVGAGTGLWTRFLLSLGPNVTSVEPDDGMRAVLESRSPQVTSLAGAAEHLPVASAVFDAVLVSSAWHWFEQPAATQEMARVLRPGGRLFVLWNGFSRAVEWLERLTDLRNTPGDANARPRGWGASLDDDGHFVEVEQVELDWTWIRTPEELVAVFGTYSGAIMKSDDQRRAMDAELRRQIDEVVTDGVVRVPMTIRGTIASRSAH